MHVIHDIECYPNWFCAGFSSVDAPDNIGYIWELSDRRNDSKELYQMLGQCSQMVGFNNMYYDWPMLRHFLYLMNKNGIVTAAEMYSENQRIFALPEQAKHLGLVDWNPSVPQVDLFMLHHLQRFGIALKQCEFTMRSRSIQDLPFPPGTVLTHAQMDMGLRYNAHDIKETKALHRRSLPAIRFREAINPAWVNFNDGKLGKKTFEQELVAAGVELYEWRDGKRHMRQTLRPDGVRLGDVILPLIRFTRPENHTLLQRIKDEIAIAKKAGDKMFRRDGSKIEHRMNLDGFHIDIKLGGIHGCVSRQMVSAAPGVAVMDADVTSYYPSIAIEHGIFPAHLGLEFCKIYGRLKARRVALPKTAPERTSLKFALNVPFGSSNDVHSFFFDPAYMLAITMNGQLMLCMLAEAFASVPGVRLIQVNTDGVCIQYPVHLERHIAEIYDWWQGETGMDLEYTAYSRMGIRDANNYIAETTDGKRKRKGAYRYPEAADEQDSKFWQQDQSALVVAKAAEAATMDDIDVYDFLLNHPDPWDFLILKKARGAARLQLADGTPLSKHTRFYISQAGHKLQKVLSGNRTVGIAAEGQAQAITIPGKKIRPAGYTCSECGVDFMRLMDFEAHNGLEHSWKITPCNVFDGQRPDDLDLRYYIAAVEKLVIA